MKIEIELPDWCDEQHIYVMAGIELAAYKNYGEDWHIKTTRCNHCGKCCQDMADDGQYELDENGDCIYLKKDGMSFTCALGASRPLSCGEGDPIKSHASGWENICCVRYKVI